MQKIKVLSQDLINKIAAGEVIERPSSVVKELIENSIDSGATEILIEVKEGGKSYIKVQDNGSGMSEKDAMISIHRHSTSKINNVEDLFSINTLGFRGEALASIAAVSNLKITTRTSDSLEGNFLEIENGIIKYQTKIGSIIGTIIEVSNLFFNTPARKKYLDNMQNEARHITDIITRYALINPRISFKLISNNNLIINSPLTSDTLSNIVYIYGTEIGKNLLQINFSDGLIEINGFISNPSYTRADKTHQSIYVNNRYIKNKIISSAIYDAYKGLLMLHRHPFVVLNINLDPKQIDVNVHPTKKEIRLSKQDVVYQSVFNAIRKTLNEHNLITEKEISDKSVQQIFESVQPFFDQQKELKAEKIIEPLAQQTLAKVETYVDDSRLPSINILGLAHNCYILAEVIDGVAVIDIHAAEERINLEDLQSQYENKGIKTQELLQPETISFAPTDSQLLIMNLNSIRNYGFIIEHFGGNDFLVRSTPVIMNKQQKKELLLDVLDELNANKVKSIDQIKDKIISRMACRKSVKQGDRIELNEMYNLIRRLYGCKNPYACAHGRPTMIILSKYELEKKFKRIV